MKVTIQLHVIILLASYIYGCVAVSYEALNELDFWNGPGDGSIQPGDPHLNQALVEIFKALKLAVADNSSDALPDRKTLRFVVFGGVAVNHWYPDEARATKDIDILVVGHTVEAHGRAHTVTTPIFDGMVRNSAYIKHATPAIITWDGAGPTDRFNIDLVAVPRSVTERINRSAMAPQNIPDLDENTIQSLDLLFASPSALFIASVLQTPTLVATHSETKIRNTLDDLTKMGRHPRFGLSGCQQALVNQYVDMYRDGALSTPGSPDAPTAQRIVDVLGPFYTFTYDDDDYYR